MSNCELCGEPMPPGEEMFKYHGYSSQCRRLENLRSIYNDLLALQDQTVTVPIETALDAVGLALRLLVDTGEKKDAENG